MRPRMYGSSDRKWCRTSTWPSRSAGTGASTRRKLSTPASPLGRDTRWICLLVAMVDVLSIGSVEPLELASAGGQRLEVLEGAGRVRDQLALVVQERALAEREAGGAPQDLAVRDEAPDAGAHEAGLHLDRHHAARLGLGAVDG